jgi:hypothetical protein
MNYKSRFLLLFCLALILNLGADIQLDKVNEFGYSHGFTKPNSTIVINDYLYTLNQHGLEVNTLDEDLNYENLTTLLIPNCSYLFAKNNKLYIFTGKEISHDQSVALYKVSIDNPTSPEIIQSLEIGSGKQINNCLMFADYFKVYYRGGSSNYHKNISIETFEEIPSQDGYLSNVQKLNNQYAILKNSFEIFDVSNPEDWTVVSDLDSVLTNNGFQTFSCLNDTILFSFGVHDISCWNISSIENIEFMGSIPRSIQSYVREIYYTNNEFILLSDNSITSVNVEDPSNPTINVVEQDQNIYFEDFFLHNDTYCFITTQGFRFYSKEDQSIAFVQECRPRMQNISATHYNNFLLIHNNNNELILYDISDPLNVEEIELNGEYNIGNRLYFYGKYIVTFDYETQYIHYYRLTNSGSILSLGIIDCSNFNPNYFQCTDAYVDENTGSIYISEYYSTILHRYTLAEYGGLQNDWNYNLGNRIFTTSIINQNAYVITTSNDEFDFATHMTVLSNLESENPEILAQIGYIIDSIPHSNPIFVSEWVAIPLDRTKFYNIADLDNVYFDFKYNDAEDLSTQILYYDDNFIDFSGIDVKVYQNFENQFNTIHCNYYKGGSSKVIRLSEIININGVEYLFSVNSTSITVFTVENFSDTEEDIQQNNVSLSQNYPNPFINNGRAETIINFNLANDAHTELTIYNVKGQKIKTLVNSNLRSGTHQVTWNGKDQGNQEVASGVYMYRLDVDGKAVKTNKCLVLK